MKQKILFFTISLFYITNSRSMSVKGFVPTNNNINAKEETKTLDKNIQLNGANKDLIGAHNIIGLHYKNNSDAIKTHLLSFIIAKNNNPLCVKTINYVMTYMLFDFNGDGMADSAWEMKPAISKIGALYINTFPDLLNKFCDLEPKDLTLKAAWQILSTIPTIYDTLCAMGIIKNKDLYEFNFNGFEKDSAVNKGLVYLNKYISLIRKVNDSEFEQKEIVLTKLIQKLGLNFVFINYVDTKIDLLYPETNYDFIHQEINKLKEEIANKLKKEENS